MTITVVIVNWNTGRLLAACLEAIAKLPEKKVISEVIVVDNFSADDSYIFAKRVDVGRPTTFVRLPENVGYAAANNLAIRRRRDEDSHILLLNPDTQVRPGSIMAACTEFEQHQQVGVVGVKLLNADHSLQPSVRQLPTFSVFISIFLKMHRLRQHLMEPAFDYSKRAVVEQVMGAGFFIRNEVIQAIGLLDERFWIWFEEVDFCKRVQDAGYQVVYTPAGEIMHHGASSFSQLVGLQKSLPLLRSALWYVRKHLGIAPFLVCLALWPLAVLFSIPASVLHQFQRQGKRPRL